MGWPKTSTVPLERGRMPTRVRSRVDLPDPLGPRSATRLPVGTVKLTWLSAFLTPPG